MKPPLHFFFVCPRLFVAVALRCPGAKLFRYDPITGQNEDFDLSSHSTAVTWQDDIYSV